MKLQEAIDIINHNPYFFEEDEIDFCVSDTARPTLKFGDFELRDLYRTATGELKIEFVDKYHPFRDTDYGGINYDCGYYYEFHKYTFTCAQLWIARYRTLPPECLLYDKNLKPKGNGLTLAMTWIMFCKNKPPKKLLHNPELMDDASGKTMAIY